MSKIPIYRVTNQRSMKRSKDGSTAELFMSSCTCKEQDDYVYNFDKRDILVVSGLQGDMDNVKDASELMANMWAKGRPPGCLIERKPVVSARQLELVRAQIYGKMNRFSNQRPA